MHSLNPPESVLKVVLTTPHPFLNYRKAIVSFSNKEIAQKFIENENFTHYKGQGILKIFRLEYFEQEKMKMKSEEKEFKMRMNEELKYFKTMLKEVDGTSRERAEQAEILKVELMKRMEEKLDGMEILEFRRRKYRNFVQWHIKNEVVMQKRMNARSRKLFFDKKTKGDITKRKHIFFVVS